MRYLDTITEHYGWQGAALAAIIITLFCIQLYYHLFAYGRIVRFRNSRRKKRLDAEPPVSVIIPMFSEDYDYLDERLPRIFAQEYAAPFEVVIVYIGSDGDFFEELTRLRLMHPNLTATKIEYNPRFPISVKMALNVGIKSAHHEHIVTTTTDAAPVTDQWLAMMGKAFMRGEIALGYAGVDPAAGIANYLMRMSQLQCSIYWLSQAVARRAYRGTRHNLGFTKSLYFGSKGFTHLNMNIGEDDLFIQKIATAKNVSVVLTPKAAVSRRLRHYGSAYRLYPVGVRNAIEWDLGSQSLFFLTVATAAAVMPVEFKAAALALLLARYAVVAARIKSIAERAGEKGVVLRYFIFDLLNPLLMLCVRIALLRKDKSVWR